MTAYEKALKSEIERVWKIDIINKQRVAVTETYSCEGVWFKHCTHSNPYESRFGPTWRDKLPARFSICSIQVLVDHTIEEGNQLFSDTAF